MNNGEKESKYLKYLPAIYQAEKADTGNFLGRFLKTFEKVLSGIADEEPELAEGEELEPSEGIEEILDRIHTYFDPLITPEKFLSWLAGWVALILKEGEGWEEEKQRKHIAQIVSLYMKRGTRDGLEEYIRIYVGEMVEVSINEFLKPLRIGFTSTVGIDTLLGQGRPYYFHVYMDVPEIEQAELEEMKDKKQTIMDRISRKRQAIINIINQEKPAHTYYGLTIKIPTMQVGVSTMVGVATLIGGLITE